MDFVTVDSVAGVMDAVMAMHWQLQWLLHWHLQWLLHWQLQW
jgi:hypothetical protein